MNSFMFSDSETGDTCVVYTRRDGDYGLLMPQNIEAGDGSHQIHPRIRSCFGWRAPVFYLYHTFAALSRACERFVPSSCSLIVHNIDLRDIYFFSIRLFCNENAAARHTDSLQCRF